MENQRFLEASFSNPGTVSLCVYHSLEGIRHGDVQTEIYVREVYSFATNRTHGVYSRYRRS